MTKITQEKNVTSVLKELSQIIATQNGWLTKMSDIVSLIRKRTTLCKIIGENFKIRKP